MAIWIWEEVKIYRYDLYRADNKDYIVVRKAMGQRRGQIIIAHGKQGDFIVKMPATKALVAIANREKNSKFLSIENPFQYIEEGYVLINVTPYNTAMKLEGEARYRMLNCPYRIMGINAKDIGDENYYAVELCARSK